MKYVTVSPEKDIRVVKREGTNDFLVSIDPAAWTSDITKAQRCSRNLLMALSEGHPWLLDHIWKVVS